MPQARDEAGNVWETDDQGNALRLLAPAAGPPPSLGGTGIGVDPTKAAAERRAEEDQQLQRDNAVRAERAADRADKTAQRQAAAAERSADAATKPTEFQSKSAGFLGRMMQAEKDFNAVPATDRGGRGIARSALHNIAPSVENSFVNSTGRQKADQAVENFIAASLRQESGASISPAEFDRQYKIFFPASGDTDELLAQKADARRQAIEGFKIAAGPLAASAIGTVQKNGAEPTDKMEVATGATRTEVVRSESDKKIAAMLAGGKPAREIKAYAKQTGQNYDGLDAALAFRSLHPQYKGAYDVSEKRVVPVSGLNRAMASPAATMGLQAANAFTGGTIDEIAGGVQSFLTGAPLSETIANADMLKQLQAQQNPTSALAGNVLGGAAAMLGGGAALRGLGLGKGAWAAANPIKAAALGDAAYGAAYGAGENNDSRLMGAAVGAPAGLAGSLLGAGATSALGKVARGVVNPAVERLRARGIPLTGGEMLGGWVKGIEDRLEGFAGPGDVLARRNMESRRALNQVGYDEAGQIVGTPVNAVGQAGLEAVNTAKTNAYSQTLDPVTIDLNVPEFKADIDELGRRVNALPTDDNAREAAREALLYRLNNNTNPNTGTMNGRGFQEAYRGLSRSARERGPNKAYATEFGDTMRGGQDAIVGALQSQNPGAYEGFLKANAANRHLSVLTDAVNAAKSQLDDGDALWTPAQLGTAATNNAKAYGGKFSAAVGDRPFDQLIRDSQEVMSSKVSDSGSAGRMLLGMALTGGVGGVGGGAGYAADGGGGAAVGALAPLAVMTALNSRGGQAALTKLLLERIAPFKKAGTSLINNATKGGTVGAAYAVPTFTGQ